MLKGLYAITDSLLLPADKLYSAVEEAIVGGAQMIQYRNKSAKQAIRVQQTTQLSTLCQSYQIPLIINDDIELAMQSQAQGVHLGQNDGCIAQAREKLGAGAIIGTSCHNSLTLALAAQKAGADYVAFGRFFPSKTKAKATVADIDILRQAKTQLEIPVVAIGGINADNAKILLDAGADMLAIIHYLFAHNDINSRATAISNLYI